jgi:hypothetical protein
MKGKGLIVVLAAVAAGGLLAITVLLFSRSESPGPGWVRAGTLQSIEGSSVKYLARAHVFVVADGVHPIALSANAMHMPGEVVSYCPSSRWFQGPHGEKFDTLGDYAMGPASSGMDRVPLRVIDSAVFVLPTQPIPGPPRNQPQPQPPAGPFCLDPSWPGSGGFLRSPG